MKTKHVPEPWGPEKYIDWSRKLVLAKRGVINRNYETWKFFYELLADVGGSIKIILLLLLFYIVLHPWDCTGLNGCVPDDNISRIPTPITYHVILHCAIWRNTNSMSTTRRTVVSVDDRYTLHIYRDMVLLSTYLGLYGWRANYL